MRERVGILRALETGLHVLLFDMPFGTPDPQTCTIMQKVLTQRWQQVRSSVVFVTHDIDEAIFLSDWIYVMTARPVSIKAKIEVPLERPRKAEMVMATEFLALRHHLMTPIRDKSLKRVASEVDPDDGEPMVFMQGEDSIAEVMAAL